MQTKHQDWSYTHFLNSQLFKETKQKTPFWRNFSLEEKKKLIGTAKIIFPTNIEKLVIDQKSILLIVYGKIVIDGQIFKKQQFCTVEQGQIYFQGKGWTLIMVNAIQFEKFLEQTNNFYERMNCISILPLKQMQLSKIYTSQIAMNMKIWDCALKKILIQPNQPYLGIYFLLKGQFYVFTEEKNSVREIIKLCSINYFGGTKNQICKYGLKAQSQNCRIGYISIEYLNLLLRQNQSQILMQKQLQKETLFNNTEVKIQRQRSKRIDKRFNKKKQSSNPELSLQHCPTYRSGRKWAMTQQQWRSNTTILLEKLKKQFNEYQQENDQTSLQKRIGYKPKKKTNKHYFSTLTERNYVQEHHKTKSMFSIKKINLIKQQQISKKQSDCSKFAKLFKNKYDRTLSKSLEIYSRLKKAQTKPRKDIENEMKKILKLTNLTFYNGQKKYEEFNQSIYSSSIGLKRKLIVNGIDAQGRQSSLGDG